MEEDSERLVVVTSTPEGVAPLTPGERAMLEYEPAQVEQAAVVGRAFPSLPSSNPARKHFDAAKEAFAASHADECLREARAAREIEPAYVPAHLYEELAMNIARRRDLAACSAKCEETIALAESLLEGKTPPPATESPIEPEHLEEILDIARYNYSDRLMRLGRFEEALEQVRMSESRSKGIEGRMKRRLKEASLLFRLGDRESSRIKLKQARGMDRELFMLLRERMAFDGHAGVDVPI